MWNKKFLKLGTYFSVDYNGSIEIAHKAQMNIFLRRINFQNNTYTFMTTKMVPKKKIFSQYGNQERVVTVSHFHMLMKMPTEIPIWPINDSASIILEINSF